jgi:signal transduction histidine kinase
LLSAVFFAGALIGASILTAVSGIYVLPGESAYYGSTWCYDKTVEIAGEVALWYYANDWMDESALSAEARERFGPDKTNLGFRLIVEERSGPDTFDSGSAATQEAQRSETVLLESYIPERAGFHMRYHYADLVVECYVSSPLTAADEFWEDKNIFDRLAAEQDMISLLLGVCAAGLLVTVVVLCLSAGRRGDSAEITLNGLDRVPLDFYLLADGLFIVFLISTIDGLFYGTGLHGVVAVIIPTLCYLMGLAALLTIAARAKAGGIFKNTLVYRSWRTLYGGIKRVCSAVTDTAGMIVKNARVTFKAGFAFIAAQLINVCLAAGFFTGGGPFFFFLGAIFNFLLLAGLCVIAVNLQRLQDGAKRLAEGELDFRVDTARMFADFKTHAERLGRIGEGMSIALEQRMRSERLKTELITNVSHDIKTPLTSIINYVDLLDKESLTGQPQEYVEVLKRQSARLRKLTEDLVEASKASAGMVNLSLEKTGVCELLQQGLGEYEEKLAQGNLETVITAPEAELYVMADGRLLWRVIDNLLNNACKYSLPGTRVYFNVYRLDDQVGILIKNISKERLNIDADELMERFVRGDASRATEGSGLGLNIARSLVELMKGSFSISADGDLFKAHIRLPCWACSL